MASLKYNGAELARVVYENNSADGMKTTHHYSFGDRGWALRRIDIVFKDGHRVKGGWKRYVRWDQDGRTLNEAVDNAHAHYRKLGWTEVTS